MGFDTTIKALRREYLISIGIVFGFGPRPKGYLSRSRERIKAPPFRQRVIFGGRLEVECRRAQDTPLFSSLAIATTTIVKVDEPRYNKAKQFPGSEEKEMPWKFDEHVLRGCENLGLSDLAELANIAAYAALQQAGSWIAILVEMPWSYATSASWRQHEAYANTARNDGLV
ncbi:hypothetical protein NPX13_g2162 [Xylaria arbuscula]|uniref:Uncharacterized protein n=1 Tax=Xylaria arbuscula TaxID=114810 RepID=A0A9W8NJP5_9PEZI|nr:hypothetical protein NPX13_g2162 [Xylaria arbuscula]